MSNSLDPDQDQRYVSPDLVLNYLRRLSVDSLLMVVIEVSGSLKEMNSRYFKSLCCLILTKHFINIKCRNKLVLENSLSVFLMIFTAPR